MLIGGFPVITHKDCSCICVDYIACCRKLAEVGIWCIFMSAMSRFLCFYIYVEYLLTNDINTKVISCVVPFSG